MRKRFHRFAKSKKQGSKPFQPRPMRPGSDKSLKQVFKKIGTPESKKFIPDAFQIQALDAIETSDCLVTAPTGAGKTWIAQQISRTVFNSSGRVWYATPLKALTNSIHHAFSAVFGQDNVGILTGDIKENTQASILIGTTEILRNQLYDAMHTGENLTCDLVILDEAHFLGDEQRGVVWEEIMIYLPVRIRLLLLSATVGNPLAVKGWLEKIRGKKCHVVEKFDRPVPLFPLFFHPSGTLFPLLEQPAPAKKTRLHKKVYKFNLAKRKSMRGAYNRLPAFDQVLEILSHYNLLPAIFFLKSRKECDQAIKLCSSSLLSNNAEQSEKLREQLDFLVSKNAHLRGHHQREIIEKKGVAAHHSGHLPAWKVVVETLMSQGLLNAMFATSTVAAGVNFPARSVVVLNSDRFNGIEFMPLSTSEYQQMTGRAGRRGMDNIGFAIIMPGRYMDLDYIASLQTQPPADLESQITINFSMVLNLLLSHSPEQINILLDKSFASYQISSGKKKGKTARSRFGKDLEILWDDFLHHMAFLEKYQFVLSDGRLTEDGLWASNLRMDSPLLVAQSIRKNLLPEDDPALLAAIIGAFVNEREFKDDPLYNQALPKRLKDTFLDIRKGLKPFAIDLLENGFDAPNLFIQPALLLYLWAHDQSWEELMSQSDFAEGDLARLILRTSENLRQISKLTETFPLISKTAREAMTLILKEPVVTD